MEKIGKPASATAHFANADTHRKTLYGVIRAIETHHYGLDHPVAVQPVPGGFHTRYPEIQDTVVVEKKSRT